MFAARVLNKIIVKSEHLYSGKHVFKFSNCVCLFKINSDIIFLFLKFAVFRQKSNAPRRMSKIVWIDMEMTGLNVRNDRIMEIACIISDNDLNVLAEHPTIVINQPDSLLASMNEWCTTTHTNVSNTLL